VTRRGFLVAASAAAANQPLTLAVDQIFNLRANLTASRLKGQASLWGEASSEFERCGVRLSGDSRMGEIRLSPGGRPIFTALNQRAINVYFTDRIPMDWDRARALAGVSTRYDNASLCVIALRYARVNRIPFLAVNTCVHELLHVITGDIFRRQTGRFSTETRELAIDAMATRLWFGGGCGDVTEAARAYRARWQRG